MGVRNRYRKDNGEVEYVDLPAASVTAEGRGIGLHSKDEARQLGAYDYAHGLETNNGRKLYYVWPEVTMENADDYRPDIITTRGLNRAYRQGYNTAKNSARKAKRRGELVQIMNDPNASPEEKYNARLEQQRDNTKDYFDALAESPAIQLNPVTASAAFIYNGINQMRKGLYGAQDGSFNPGNVNWGTVAKGTVDLGFGVAPILGAFRSGMLPAGIAGNVSKVSKRTATPMFVSSYSNPEGSLGYITTSTNPNVPDYLFGLPPEAQAASNLLYGDNADLAELMAYIYKEARKHGEDEFDAVGNLYEKGVKDSYKETVERINKWLREQGKDEIEFGSGEGKLIPPEDYEVWHGDVYSPHVPKGYEGKISGSTVAFTPAQTARTIQASESPVPVYSEISPDIYWFSPASTTSEGARFIGGHEGHHAAYLQAPEAFESWLSTYDDLVDLALSGVDAQAEVRDGSEFLAAFRDMRDYARMTNNNLNTPGSYVYLTSNGDIGFPLLESMASHGHLSAYLNEMNIGVQKTVLKAMREGKSIPEIQNTVSEIDKAVRYLVKHAPAVAVPVAGGAAAAAAASGNNQPAAQMQRLGGTLIRKVNGQF